MASRGPGRHPGGESDWQFDSDFIVYDIDKDSWFEPILKALVPAK